MAFLLKILFFFFGRSLSFLSDRDYNIKNEISYLPDGFKIALKIFGLDNPVLCFKKIDNKLCYSLTCDIDNADLIIEFKSLKSALKIFLGLKGLEVGFAEKRMILKGMIADGLMFTRISMIVQRYLFPAFICKRIMKKLPEINKILKIKLYLYGIVRR